MPSPSTQAESWATDLTLDPATWIDANSRVFQQWFEWQAGMWQALLEMQSQWLRQWQADAGEWPLWIGGYRGAEQLA